MENRQVDKEEMSSVLGMYRERLINAELFEDVCVQPSNGAFHMTSAENNMTMNRGESVNKISSQSDLLMRIEDIMRDIIKCIGRKDAPSLSFYNTRSWDNISYKNGIGLELVSKAETSVRFDSITSVNKFALTVKILSLIYKLVQEDSYCTKRDLYYQDVNLYGSQSTVDSIVDNISCMLGVPRWELHVLATSKGLIAGSLQFEDADGNFIDCSKTDTGVLVPNHVIGISNFITQAEFIVIVEKDATFQKLLDDGLCTKYLPCIMITGKGFPDVNTRLLIRRLWDTFHLPTFALVDADPHGLEIMAVYKYGSRAMSFEASNLTIPAVSWLGILPSDVNKLQISSDVLLPLTEKDIEKANQLLTRPYMTARLRQEVELIMSRGLKAEIQCLDTLGSCFLTDIYIPNKILSQSWI